MAKKSFLKSYGFIIFMLLGIVCGCLIGAFAPELGAKLEPLGTVFINLMFCIVVPLVFFSISSAIANAAGAKRAGKLMGVTVGTFLVTAAIAAVFMYIVILIFPISSGKVVEDSVEVAGLGFADLLVNFFTKPDFFELLSRKAILPLIVFAILFGFGVQKSGGKETLTAKILANVTDCILNMMKIVTYYAPIGFLGFFASLVAAYGPDLIGQYSRTLIIYYVVCFVYMFIFFPIYARFGGGKGAVKVMFQHLFQPAAVSFGTCSSVATIPTNMEAAEDTGISREVSNVVLPMGATMHMDGSCFSCVLKISFLFGVFGIPFEGAGLIVKILLVAVFSSVAMSGIPGGGYIGEYIICSLFFPTQMAIAYPIAVTIGNLVDPPATMINSAGDYVVSFLVARFIEGKDWFERAGKA